MKPTLKVENNTPFGQDAEILLSDLIGKYYELLGDEVVGEEWQVGDQEVLQFVRDGLEMIREANISARAGFALASVHLTKMFTVFLRLASIAEAQQGRHSGGLWN